MRRRNKLITLIVSAAILTAFSGCASNDPAKATEATTTTTKEIVTATLAEEDKEIISTLETDGDALENPVVKWLSFWDINPIPGKAIPVELELFSERYNGVIEYHTTTWDDKFERLSILVASGDSPDMFPGADMDVMPRLVVSGLLQPTSDYIDFSKPAWAEMKSINELFQLNGKNYVAATAADAGVVCIYNMNTIEENGLSDPSELFKAGEWDWDALMEMMVAFCSPEEGKYATDGWWFESALSLSTGVPYIGISDSKIVHNLDNSLIEKAQSFMESMNRGQLPIPKAQFDWTVQPKRVGDGLTLFYPVGIWQLYQADLSDFGDSEDIRFVPMPRCPDADAYYTSIGLSAFTIPAGASNPEGAAAFIECARIAASSDEVKEIQKKQFYEDYGWNDNMYEMHQLAVELVKENPVVECYSAVNSLMDELVNNPMKESFNNGASWTQTKESMRPGVEAELESVNAKIAEQMNR